MNRRVFALILIGIAIGILFSLQAKSFSEYSNSIRRENKVNQLREILIIKRNNQNLQNEIDFLKSEIENGFNSQESIKKVEAEIERLALRTGEVDIIGPGVMLVISKAVPIYWFVDLYNEFLLSGAEAVAINGVRITDDEIGFDVLPNGQIMVGNQILVAPYRFEIIGDSKTLISNLSQKGGIVERFLANFGNESLKLNEKEKVLIRKIKQ